jgi:hypothetical protein
MKGASFSSRLLFLEKNILIFLYLEKKEYLKDKYILFLDLNLSSNNTF